MDQVGSVVSVLVDVLAQRVASAGRNPSGQNYFSEMVGFDWMVLARFRYVRVCSHIRWSWRLGGL